MPTLTDQFAVADAERLREAQREYVALLHRNEAPRPDDVDLAKRLLAALSRTFGEMQEDLKVVQAMARHQKQADELSDLEAATAKSAELLKAKDASLSAVEDAKQNAEKADWAWGDHCSRINWHTSALERIEKIKANHPHLFGSAE